MKQQEQVELIKSILPMIDAGTAVDAGSVVKNPTSSYVCKDLAKRERTSFFENHAQVIGLSGDLPEPGSFMTVNDLGIPILATRDKSGKFHALVNACRHRGALLTEDERGKKNRFSCPFHAWTYASDGQLLGIREPKLFGDIDKKCNGLVELPCAEKYGLLVIHPQLDGTVDIDGLLGEELAQQLETWEFGESTFLGNSTLEKDLNWKIAMDSYGENYHFDTLHRGTVGNLFYGDATGYDQYGRNHRLTLISHYIDTVRERPETDWHITDAGVLLYHLFPNVQIVLFNRVITLIRIYPDPENVGRSITRLSHYSAQYLGADVEGEEVQNLEDKLVYEADMTKRLEFNLRTQIELFDSTVDEEDYYMGEKSQQAAASGKVEYFIFGRNEPALHHFHNNYRDALGLPPLEEYRAAS